MSFKQGNRIIRGMYHRDTDSRVTQGVSAWTHYPAAPFTRILPSCLLRASTAPSATSCLPSSPSRCDDSWVRSGDAAENLAVVRHLALILLRRETTAKVGIKAKWLMCGWDATYLAKVLTA